jgi:hypothetical protein
MLALYGGDVDSLTLIELIFIKFLWIEFVYPDKGILTGRGRPVSSPR